MRKSLREMLEKLQTMKEEARSLLDADKVDEAEKKTEEIRALQKKIDLEKALGDEETGDGETRGRKVDVQVTKDAGDREFRSIGEQLIAVATATRSPHKTDERLLRLNQEAELEARATGMSEGVPSDGGFAVQKDFVEGLWRRSYETGVLASKARRIQVGANSNGIKMNAVDESSRAHGSRWGGIRGYWVNEAEAPTKSKPKLRKMNIDLEKMAALLYATEELLQDASALTSLINQGVPEEFGFLLDDAMFNGDGAGKPLGILGSAALITVSKEASQAAGTVLAENILKMWSRMPARLRAGAEWYINQDVEPQLFQMSVKVKNVAGTENVGGFPVYMPPNGLSTAPYGTLLGRPVRPIEQAATVGTTGDIVFANYGEYALIEKNGIQAATSIHVKFEEGETAFRFILRVNGQPMWDKALTPFQGSNTLSPFVALETRI